MPLVAHPLPHPSEILGPQFEKVYMAPKQVMYTFRSKTPKNVF